MLKSTASVANHLSCNPNFILLHPLFIHWLNHALVHAESNGHQTVPRFHGGCHRERRARVLAFRSRLCAILDSDRAMRFSVSFWATRYFKSTREPSTCCAHCRYRENDRAVLESAIPGLDSFSSGFGASVADSRLCTFQDRLTSPGDWCNAFEGRSASPVVHFSDTP